MYYKNIIVLFVLLLLFAGKCTTTLTSFYLASFYSFCSFFFFFFSFSWGVGAVRFCGAYSIVLWSVCSQRFLAFTRRSGWSFYFIYFVILFVAWRESFMVHWCGTFVAFKAFVAFIRRLGCPLFVAFRVFVTFMGHWGGTLVAFTMLVVFNGHWGWTFMVFFSVCSV